MNRSFCLILASSTLALGGAAAHAQSSPTTCSVDEVNNFLLILVNGQATTVESGSSGVLVNGVVCAWPDEIDHVTVVGGDRADRVTFRGSFIPGSDLEPGWDELEVGVELHDGTDTVILELSGGRDVVNSSVEVTNALKLNDDTDDDFFMVGVEVFKVYAMGGNDAVTMATLTIPALYMYGGDGNDDLRGSAAGDDVIDGEAGNDVLGGESGDDRLIGGPGSDDFAGHAGVDTVDYRAKTAAVTVTIGNGAADDGEAGEQDSVPGDIEAVLGGKGADVLVGSALANTLDGGAGNDRLDGGFGADLLIGGAGNDTADYAGRFATVGVFIGNGLADDGELDEGDDVDSTVENATGGAANDILIGSAAKNTLRGGPGNDTLDGQNGDDKLYGDAGDDSLLGGDGADKLYGSDGADVLDGGAGADVYTAGGGNDFLYNDDGVAETVNCGPGNADDAEVDTGAIDTFIGCEL